MDLKPLSYMEGFRKFVGKGNVIDVAAGIMIGAAFTALVNSFVSNILSPPLGILIDNLDLSDFFIILKKGNPLPPYPTLEDAQKAGAVTLNYGLFFNAFFSFLITGMFLYLLIKKIIKDFIFNETKAPAKLTKQEELLTDIRDLLSQNEQQKPPSAKAPHQEP